MSIPPSEPPAGPAARTRASVRDQPVARELVPRLVEGEVRRRDDHVGLLQVVVAEPVALPPHELEHLLEERVEARLVARLDRGDRLVVELVEAWRVLVGEPVLILRRDADDHRCPSWGCCEGVPSSSAGALGAEPWPSSSLSFSRSSSPTLDEAGWASWRSMSSWPSVRVRLSSKAPAASSSSIAFARARMPSVLSTARCIARPTSAISSPTPVAASEIRTDASTAEYCALMTSFLVRNCSSLPRSFCSLSMSCCCWPSSSVTCWSRDCSSVWANCLRSSAVRARSSLPAASAWRAWVSSLTTCCSSLEACSCSRFLAVTTSAMPFLTFCSSSICFWYEYSSVSEGS